MKTRLTTGLLSCLMMSLLVGCAASPNGLIRGQSPAAPDAYSGHAFGANTQAAPFPYNTFVGNALKRDVMKKTDAYYGNSGGMSASHGYPAGHPVSYAESYGAHGGHGHYGASACENGHCQDPHCQNCHGQYHPNHLFGGCLHKHGKCHHCNGHGCPHCKGTGRGSGGIGHGSGGNWAPTHLYQHMYKIPQGMAYPQNPTPGAITVYPYYTHKGPDDFFYPAMK